ncbi:M23 family metallopeptidase [Labilibaculum sp. K2S]|uniref:M23 family metallopeptidase n=1 Tax=Labilibaculum sp. K2S TaxID=3056386 RepID=UPI0025A4913C|nr:M23 family metallopeptidase [Labilibaculum sp. K2S]MDM8158246.1 M23 family metallopeptidase [Labilibaculum sp. K2S]
MKITRTYTILTLLALLFLFSKQIYSQSIIFPQNYFRSPVDFDITLSGNFAELRNNHFHSGIDIRTFTTGKKVHAVADGFVSRIKISSGGYGKAIYIDHPNGYTSVFAHLDHFNKDIEEFVKSYQYQNNTFEFDLNISKDEILVKKGTVIAFSGNTGSSAGPHLHFEIRDTKSEHPLNPLLFGFKIKDTTPPKIFNFYAYPLDSASNVNGFNSRQRFPVTFYNKAFHLKSDPKLKLLGNIGFALETNDYMDNTWGKCGIFDMKMKINDTLISSYSFEEFSFDESTYINSHLDYELNVSHNKRIHKTFKEPNNQLSIYSKMKNNGIFLFKKNTDYKIDFLVSDANLNKSNLRIYAAGNEIEKIFPKGDFDVLMNYDRENTFKKENIEVKFPKNSFYSNIPFTYSFEQDSNYLSDIHCICNENVPVHNYYTISIKPKSIPKGKSDKLLIARIDKKGEITNEGGIYFNSSVKTKSRYFGKFAVSIDTIPPTIKPITNFSLKSLNGQKSIRFAIKDDLAGIKSYEGSIDGKWVLFEYDAKNDLLFYVFDSKRLAPNKNHQLQVKVTDQVQNQKIFTSNFIW